MYNLEQVICVTNRHLVSGDFLAQIEKVLKCGPKALVLREKDLTEEEYAALAKPVLSLCRNAGVPCMFNGQEELAEKMGADGVHLSLSAAKLRSPGSGLKLGVSVHSAEEAAEAEKLGASYIFFGHVFETDCKKGLPGRGLEALMRVCQTVSIPVYAIGGISPQNMELCFDAGAAGVCMMSGLMRAGNV